MPGDPRPYDSAALRGSGGKRLASFVEPVTGPGETTTHVAVVDRWGNFVTYTNTIESSHGIGVFAGYKRDDGTRKGHGFLLNNELTDFNLTPQHEPLHRHARLQRRAAGQAPAQQHGADDDLHARR